MWWEVLGESLDFASLDDMQEALGLDEEDTDVSLAPRRRGLSNGRLRRSDEDEAMNSEGECCCEYDENPKEGRAHGGYQMDLGDDDYIQQERNESEKIVAAEAVVNAINKALSRQDISSVQRGPTLPYFDAEDQLHHDVERGPRDVTRRVAGHGEHLETDQWGDVEGGGGLAHRQYIPGTTPSHLLDIDPLNYGLGEEERNTRARLSRNPSYIYAVDEAEADLASDALSSCSTISSTGSRRITPVRVIRPEVHMSDSGHHGSQGEINRNRRSTSPQRGQPATHSEHLAPQNMINKEDLAYVRRSVSGSELKTLAVRGGAGQLEEGGVSSCEALHVYGGGNVGVAKSNGSNSSQYSLSPSCTTSVPLGDGAVGTSLSVSAGTSVVRSASLNVVSVGSGQQVRCASDNNGEKLHYNPGLGSFSEGNSRSNSRSPSPNYQHIHPSPSASVATAHDQSPKLARNTSLTSSFKKILRIKSVPGLKTTKSTPNTPASYRDDPWLPDEPGSPGSPGSPGVGVDNPGGKTKKSQLHRVSSSLSRHFNPNKGMATPPSSVSRSLSNGQMMLVHDSNGPNSTKGVDLVEYEALMKLFTCPGCQVLMTPPLYQCKKGHIVCVTCRSACKQMCPTCKQKFQDTTNMMMEQVCNLLKFPCRYSTEGCPQLYTPRARIDHEHFCEYRPVHCHNANKGCKVVMILKDMNKHMKECSFK